ncbi:FAD-dependent pyridine nucleotide-disulphide oxidoreductase [Trichormus variabilis ATCC 29413]|uniref:demethylphylloquinone reductase n=2 Tax=Anabaena variabilis TaxID=264691 RepID=Q3MF02_TRIV2|nr:MULTISPECIES: NAD(P)/FAD-dependent oxidoreductase [Nostocaceae]ABA20434.1 FAD-dependent pyridine nucleotide-disulphide oxidoreductase [Trichormus variabilis ATCC 29413]MBC1216724.1 NAD(P)/FAD-dependent oxidoreductase [Trichormus variabilis ARAD]MBC1258200.1 NAD(P)/FAD-dependent oxidoreductase [Trichormus variabilis V5]MBC1269108.1 NAD(P)/FAD-dependent oxidoreductase [Trichormus variabilis FSR]MBC1304487.1 NAD(P)/FAD-dependent oxidoreductase [Trichormus variabilis N2B]
MTEQTKRIVILGGGFGGLYTALRLSQLPWETQQKPEIVLVDQSDRFLFSPLLYELLTGELQSWEIAPPFIELLEGTGIRFYQAVVSGIDIDQQRVHLQDGPEIPYDRLVLTLGGETPLDLVPGATSYAYPFRTIADTYRLEERLRVLEESDAEKIRVAIVGAGYSGVELACKLADRLGERGRFRLVEISDQILRTSPDFNREAAKKALDAKGVFIDLETKVESIGQNTISLEYKNQVDTIPVDLVIWTVGTRVTNVVKSLPFKQNQRGQITNTPTLQVLDHPDIFALGDLADCIDAEGQQVPATAQAAFQQADYAAWNIWASLTQRPLLPFRYQQLGEMLALGTDNATLTGLGVKLDGSLAYVARRLAYLYRLPTLDHQLKVGFNWLVRPIIETIYSAVDAVNEKGTKY